MKTSELDLPKTLTVLIKAGKWTPSGTPCGKMINLGEEAARKLSPEDDQLVLMPAPFHTIADEVKCGNTWWMTDLTNVGEIDYEKALIIADFGMGSDSTIILYYGSDAEPEVMYLKWSYAVGKVSHSWVKTHSTFGDFAADVGLVDF